LELAVILSFLAEKRLLGFAGESGVFGDLFVVSLEVAEGGD
jgi:hypothetical protein